MGNICSRSSNEPDAFAGTGRVVGTNPSDRSTAPRASVPAQANWKNTPGRTLGDSSPGGAQGGGDEARSNAAIAAQNGKTLIIVGLQKRAETASSANKGKLASKLAEQKLKTQAQTLNEVSEAERANRAQDDQRKMAAYQ
ncbi:hypothetical protein N7532_005965 [Penicillium argentinense]|uniref:Uncharacterized protein n=1 Tax=Penicillium argentinense TaxID=1131581 RepID=A0A9W9FF08_9EURO|nr:uncharacterized protein N7532_005965 [Penicillium argentinense]KAJ5098964.1 hypothetical protein N7532_005965 [Penicillium argentinense]